MTKFGRKFGSYQVATADKVFSLGLMEMKCGTAEHTLQKLKVVLQDVEESCLAFGQENAGKKILNTTSDRHIVQKISTRSWNLFRLKSCQMS